MDEQQSPRPAGRVSRLSEIRRRRKRRRQLTVLAAMLLVAAILAGVAGVYGSAMVGLGDVLDSVRIWLQPGPGFPVHTGVRQALSVQPVNGGFALLGTQDLQVYSDSGRQLRSIQHSYARPGLAAGGSHLCLYSRGGYELRVESRSQTLYTASLPGSILLCDMSSNDSLAVLTTSTRGTAELIVYDSRFRKIYGWQMTESEGDPLVLAFAPDNRQLAVGAIRTQDGRLVSQVHLLDTGSDYVTATYSATGSLLLAAEWLSNNRLLAVFDSFAVVLSSKGEEVARLDYSPGEEPMDVSVCGRTTALLLWENTVDESGRLLILNDTLTALADFSLYGAEQVVCGRTAAYCMTNDSVHSYDFSGDLNWEHSSLSSPQALLVRGGKVMLFTSEKAELLDSGNETGGASA